MNNRWKNYALWVSILAFVPLLAQGLGVYNIHIILPGNYGDLANALLGILTLAGILNNPTSVNPGFGDDKPTE
jgi:uncharacterized membrane protein